jgi:DegV family protein with EDD domain
VNVANKAVAIVTDRTCNLPDDLIVQYDINVIAQILNWAGESLLDGIDSQPEAFYERLSTSATIPTTSQPSAGEFFEYLSKVAESADSIVAVLISDELSGTIGCARTAVDMMEGTPIEIVDSRAASMGLGFAALEAARAAASGMSAKEVAQVAKEVAGRVRVMFVVDTLEYLHRGGRIGGASRMIGSMLALKPVLHLDDGKIDTLAKIRTKKKAMRYMLDVVKEEAQGRKIHASVINALAPVEGEQLKATLEQEMDVVEFIPSDLSPVIGTHVGPGTVGIVYYADEA